MIGTTNRAARRTKAARRGKSAAVAAAAATAMTLGLTGAPTANAAIAVDVDWDPVYTAGTLAGILNWVSDTFPGTSLPPYNSGPPATVGFGLPIVYPFDFDVPLIGKITITINLDIKALLTLKNFTPGDTQALYNTLAGIPQPTCANTYSTNCRYSVMLGTSEATLSLANAYRAEIASVRDGVTPQSYIPFTASPDATAEKPAWTNQLLAFLQNPLRPNGGFLSRFPELAEFLGQDPTMPAAGQYKSEDGRIVLNSTTIDATWAYDPTGDFPVAPEFWSVLNSLLAGLPLNLVTGGISSTQPFVLADAAGKPAKIDDIGVGLFSLFQVPISPVPLYGTYTLAMEPGKGYYATIVPNQMPVLTPLRLPALLINAVLGALGSPLKLGTPIADALEGAMKILVNIGYDDVVTPTMISEDPGTYGGYQAYDRTFLKSAIATPFGSVDPLTQAERAALPGDIFQALVSGFQAELAKPFFGILVDSAAPSSAASSAAVAPAPAARVATPVAAAAETAVAETTQAETVLADTPALVAATPKAAPVRPAHRVGSSTTRSAAAPSATAGSDNQDDVRPAASAGGKHRARS